jgi:hypothetical protein
MISLAGAVDAGSSVKGFGEAEGRKRGTGGGGDCRGLLRASVIMVPLWLSPSSPFGGVAGIRTSLGSSLEVDAFAFSFLIVLFFICAAYSAFSFIISA